VAADGRLGYVAKSAATSEWRKRHLLRMARRDPFDGRLRLSGLQPARELEHRVGVEVRSSQRPIGTLQRAVDDVGHGPTIGQDQRR
jgi:hypothetical protein